MRKLVLALVVSILGTLPAGVHAQSQQELCERIAIIETGQWMLFGLSGQQGIDSMRIANVGDEKLDGKVYHRYEMQISSPQGSLVSQTLTAGRIFDTSDVKEMVVQIPGMPIQRLTGEMLRTSLAMRPSQNQLITDEVCKSAESLGRETVKVPAGNIEALHIRTAEGHEAWITADVPGAMVKVVTNEGMTMMLVQYGTGAESTIKN